MMLKRTLKFKLPLDNRLTRLLKYLKEIKNKVAYICFENDFRSLNKLHRNVYYKIKCEYPFIPARYVIDIEREILSLRKGSKVFHSFKSYSAWLTVNQSFKFDWESISILYEAYGKGKEAKWITFSLNKDKRKKKYGDWTFKEARLKFDGENLWFHLIVEKEVEKKNVTEFIGVDINFDNITLSNSEKIPYDLKRVLAIQYDIEKIQKRYNKQWKHNKGILRAIRKRFKHIRDYITDLAWKVANKVVSFNANIVMEDLRNLKKNVDYGRKFNKKLNLWAYRKIQKAIEIKAEEHGLTVFYVDPKHTSTICYNCGSKLKVRSWKELYCENCNTLWDRDYLASLNILKRFEMWVGRQPEPLQLDAIPRGMKR